MGRKVYPYLFQQATPGTQVPQHPTATLFRADQLLIWCFLWHFVSQRLNSFQSKPFYPLVSTDKTTIEQYHDWYTVSFDRRTVTSDIQCRRHHTECTKLTVLNAIASTSRATVTIAHFWRGSNDSELNKVSSHVTRLAATRLAYLREKRQVSINSGSKDNLNESVGIISGSFKTHRSNGALKYGFPGTSYLYRRPLVKI